MNLTDNLTEMQSKHFRFEFLVKLQNVIGLNSTVNSFVFAEKQIFFFILPWKFFAKLITDKTETSFLTSVN